jgi:hypothetical protein
MRVDPVRLSELNVGISLETGDRAVNIAGLENDHFQLRSAIFLLPQMFFTLRFDTFTGSCLLRFSGTVAILHNHFVRDVVGGRLGLRTLGAEN